MSHKPKLFQNLFVTPHPIVYDLVLTNKGNGYNKRGGIFIAPDTGVYVFHFSVCVIEGPETPWTSLEITRNGNALGSTFEEGTHSGSGYHCGSTLVISDVTVGVHIFIRTQERNDPRSKTSVKHMEEPHFLASYCFERNSIKS